MTVIEQAVAEITNNLWVLSPEVRGRITRWLELVAADGFLRGQAAERFASIQAPANGVALTITLPLPEGATPTDALNFVALAVSSAEGEPPMDKLDRDKLAICYLKRGTPS